MADRFFCLISGAQSNRSRNLVQHESLAPLGPERQFRGLFLFTTSFICARPVRYCAKSPRATLVVLMSRDRHLPDGRGGKMGDSLAFRNDRDSRFGD